MDADDSAGARRSSPQCSERSSGDTVRHPRQHGEAGEGAASVNLAGTTPVDVYLQACAGRTPLLTPDMESRPMPSRLCLKRSVCNLVLRSRSVADNRAGVIGEECARYQCYQRYQLYQRYQRGETQTKTTPGTRNPRRERKACADAEYFC
ncbi:unnamed protein product [Lampetra fluviatilis]